MKKSTILNAIILPMLLITMACESGGGGDDDPTVDVTGTWAGSFSISTSSSGITLILKQNGNEVSGYDNDGTPFTGNVSGNNLSLSSSVSKPEGSATLEVSGPVENNTMQLSGTVVANLTDGTHVSVPATIATTKR